MKTAIKPRERVINSLDHLIKSRDERIAEFTAALAKHHPFEVIKWKGDTVAVMDWAGRWAQELRDGLDKTHEVDYAAWIQGQVSLATERLIQLAGRNHADNLREAEGTKLVRQALTDLL